MIDAMPTTLEGRGVRLEPLSQEHHDDLVAATEDGRLWELWYTGVPSRDRVATYISDALKGRDAGHMMPWAVRHLESGKVIGSTRYHDIVPAIDRLEIGATWYAQTFQRTNVNATCKLLLLEHVFESLGCNVVGLRTDAFNFRSQKAIERLGAKRNGILRHHARRQDGTVRDTVFTAFFQRNGRTCVGSSSCDSPGMARREREPV